MVQWAGAGNCFIVPGIQRVAICHPESVRHHASFFAASFVGPRASDSPMVMPARLHVCLPT
jgi:hypothetical protein